MNNLQPKVSICCMTYNHEKYIRDAIEGFIIQKTTFSIEIIIHDDASTDNTSAIIKEYAEKYSNLIIPILQVENQYSKGIKPLYNYIAPIAQGKYIALCEGDDYWTDPYKLQKQVDYLKANPDYGMVHTDADQHYTVSSEWVKNFNKTLGKEIPEDNVFENILKSNYPVFTCTTLLRRECLEYLDPKMPKFKMGDTALWLEIAHRKKIKYFPESTAVRQLLEESATQSKNIQKKLDFKISIYELFLYFIQKYGCSEETKRIVYLNSLFVIMNLSLQCGNFNLYNEYKSILKSYKMKLSLIQRINLLKSIIKYYFKIIYF